MNESNDVRQDDSSSPPEKSPAPGEYQPIGADAPALSVQGREANADHEPESAAGKLVMPVLGFQESTRNCCNFSTQ